MKKIAIEKRVSLLNVVKTERFILFLIVFEKIPLCYCKYFQVKKVLIFDLKSLKLFESFLIWWGKWLKNFDPEWRTPLWTSVKLVEGRCKSFLNQVFKSWTSEFSVNKSLCPTTNSNKENIYWDENVSIWRDPYRSLVYFCGSWF